MADDAVDPLAAKEAIADFAQRGGALAYGIASIDGFAGRFDIAAATGVHVVLLRKREPDDAGPAIRVPTADDRIDEGDRLVVSGTKSAVESLDVI